MMAENSNQAKSLKRVIGVFGAVGLGLGSILGTGVFVSLALVTDVAGIWAPAAVTLAGLLAACNGLSSAQLAAAHPISGGTYEYGHHYVHPMAGYTAGWMFLVAKSASAATAALGLATYLRATLDIYHPLATTSNIALVAVALITALAAGGMRRSSTVNTIIVAITLTALCLYVLSGAQALSAPDVTSHLVKQAFTNSPLDPSTLMHATALAFVAYAGYGRIATMGEEITEPRKNIPRAIIATLLVSMVTYISVVIVSVGLVGPVLFSSAGTRGHAPLEQVARYMSQPELGQFIAIGAITAMTGVLLNLLLGLSRVLLAMARRKEMPQALSVLTPSGESPKRAVWAVGAFIALLVSTGDITVTWSLSAFCVLIYYGTTNLAALKMPTQDQLYPRWISMVGLVGCLSLALFIDGQAIAMGCAAIVFAFGLRKFFVAKS
jgi:APA family basic amino acid/polyamine antiporter